MVHLQGTQFVTFTNAAGEYQFKAIVPGVYTIVFPSEGYQYSGTNPTVTVSSSQDAVAPSVSLTPKVVSAFNIGELAGMVTKSPMLTDETDEGNVPVQIRNASYSFTTSTPSRRLFPRFLLQTERRALIITLILSSV